MECSKPHGEKKIKAKKKEGTDHERMTILCRMSGIWRILVAVHVVQGVRCLSGNCSDSILEDYRKVKLETRSVSNIF